MAHEKVMDLVAPMCVKVVCCIVQIQITCIMTFFPFHFFTFNFHMITWIIIIFIDQVAYSLHICLYIIVQNNTKLKEIISHM
jgi:hypothetical protein